MSADAPDRHGWESWTWDDSVFHGTAAYYRTGRYPYAPGLAEALTTRLGLDGSGRLLDAGCGPGTVALAFARLFEAVVGLDPDPDMIAEATRAAAEAGVSHASWVRARAESLPDALGTFPRHLVRAVLPLDGPAAGGGRRPTHARAARRSGPGRPGGLPREPRAVARRPLPVARSSDRRAADPMARSRSPGRHELLRTTSPSGEDDVFVAAGFAPEATVVVPDGRVIHPTIDEVVARVFSARGPHPISSARGWASSNISFASSSATPRPADASPCGCRTTVSGSGSRRRRASAPVRAKKGFFSSAPLATTISGSHAGGAGEHSRRRLHAFGPDLRTASSPRPGRWSAPVR